MNASIGFEIGDAGFEMVGTVGLTTGLYAQCFKCEGLNLGSSLIAHAIETSAEINRQYLIGFAVSIDASVFDEAIANVGQIHLIRELKFKFNSICDQSCLRLVCAFSIKAEILFELTIHRRFECRRLEEWMALNNAGFLYISCLIHKDLNLHHTLYFGIFRNFRVFRLFNFYLPVSREVIRNLNDLANLARMNR